MLCTQPSVYLFRQPRSKKCFLWKRLCLPAGKRKPLYTFSYQINISYFRSSRLRQTLFSSNSSILCYPAQSSSFVCLYLFSPKKRNRKQRVQLVRQLDSCFVSSTHPLSHMLIAILSSFSSHLPFTWSFMWVFFSPHIPLPPAWCSVWNHVIFAVMYFSFQDTESIYNSLSVSAVHLLFIAPPSSFFPPVSLSLHLFQPEPALSSITEGLVWPVCTHTHTDSLTHTHTQIYTSAKHCCPFLLCSPFVFPLSLPLSFLSRV